MSFWADQRYVSSPCGLAKYDRQTPITYVEPIALLPFWQCEIQSISWRKQNSPPHVHIPEKSHTHTHISTNPLYRILLNALRLGLRIIASLLLSILRTTLVTPAAAFIPFSTRTSRTSTLTPPAEPLPTTTSTVTHKLNPTRSRIQINNVMIVLSRTSKAERDMMRRIGLVGFDKPAK